MGLGPILDRLTIMVGSVTTLSRHIHFVTWVVMATIALGNVATAASSTSPTEVIKSTIDDVTRLLSDDKIQNTRPINETTPDD